MAEIKQFRRGNCKWYAAIVRSHRDVLYVITANGCWNDNPIRLDNGSIVYDFPERIPGYAKMLTERAFRYLDRHGKEMKDVQLTAT